MAGWVGCEKMGSGVLDSNEISICCPWWGKLSRLLGLSSPLLLLPALFNPSPRLSAGLTGGTWSANSFINCQLRRLARRALLIHMLLKYGLFC